VNIPQKAAYAAIAAIAVVAIALLAAEHQGPVQGSSVIGSMLNDGRRCYLNVERHFSDDETEGNYWQVIFEPPFCSFSQWSKGSSTTGRNAIGEQVKEAVSK